MNSALTSLLVSMGRRQSGGHGLVPCPQLPLLFAQINPAPNATFHPHFYINLKMKLSEMHSDSKRV